jgi:hypothetical protein
MASLMATQACLIRGRWNTANGAFVYSGDAPLLEDRRDRLRRYCEMVEKYGGRLATMGDTTIANGEPQRAQSVQVLRYKPPFTCSVWPVM